MRNNGNKVNVESPAMTAESVVDNRSHEGRSSSSDTSSSSSSRGSCLSTTEEMKEEEEVASSWEDEESAEEMVVVGCQRCYLYVLVLKEKQRCPKCKCNNLIQI
ncbi:unnamed protein product [Cochlearia groenlandica]